MFICPKLIQIMTICIPTLFSLSTKVESTYIFKFYNNFLSSRESKIFLFHLISISFLLSLFMRERNWRRENIFFFKGIWMINIFFPLFLERESGLWMFTFLTKDKIIKFEFRYSCLIWSIATPKVKIIWLLAFFFFFERIWLLALICQLSIQNWCGWIILSTFSKSEIGKLGLEWNPQRRGNWKIIFYDKIYE